MLLVTTTNYLDIDRAAPRTGCPLTARRKHGVTDRSQGPLVAQYLGDALGHGTITVGVQMDGVGLVPRAT